MDSALLDDEQLPDAGEGTDNLACNMKDERVDAWEEGYAGQREGLRLSRAGSEGDLLSPRHGGEPPAYPCFIRRPSLSGLRSTPSGQEAKAAAGAKPLVDLSQGSGDCEVSQATRDIRTDVAAGRSQIPSNVNQLSVSALLRSYERMRLGKDGPRPAIEWPYGEFRSGRRGSSQTELISTDVSSITIRTVGKESTKVPEKTTKSILDGCEKCGKVMWKARGGNGPGVEEDADATYCLCRTDDTVLAMDDNETAAALPKTESSVATKVQKVIDRMQSAFSTTSSSGVSRVSSMEERTCRICWVGEEKEEAITPCDCAGSSAYVHASCLRKWLQVTTQYRCEICRHEYATKRKMKPFAEWKFRGAKTSYMSQVEATLILLGIVTPPLICGIILCSQKIMEYINSPEDAWKTAALMTLVLASSCTYIAAIIYLCRKFTSLCKTWVKRNQRTIVRIGDIETVIEPEDEDEAVPDTDPATRERSESVGSRSDVPSVSTAPADGPSSLPITESVMVWGLT